MCPSTSLIIIKSTKLDLVLPASNDSYFGLFVGYSFSKQACRCCEHDSKLVPKRKKMYTTTTLDFISLVRLPPHKLRVL